jgi:hypothetical protein
MLKNEIEIDQFKKRTWKNKSQPALIFETGNFSHEPETNSIERKL